MKESLRTPAELVAPLTFFGRTFSVSELELMRQTSSEFAALGVTEICRTICELLEWKRVNFGARQN